jgi:hypothetical protein
MKDYIWVFQQFGFRVGFSFLIDSCLLKVQRLWTGKKPPSMEDLTEEDWDEIEEAFFMDPNWDEKWDKPSIHVFDDTIN